MLAVDHNINFENASVDGDMTIHSRTPTGDIRVPRGQTKTWHWFTNLWQRRTDRLCSTSRAVQGQGKQLEDMDWQCSMPGLTQGSTHSQYGLLSPGTGCQRAWEQRRLESLSKDGSEGQPEW